MQEYLRSIFGFNIKMRKIEDVNNLPLYLATNYEYYEYEIEGINCIFVRPLYATFIEWKKQYEKIKQLFNKNIVLQLKSVTSYQREVLIENRIPFIVEKMQVYLPFMAISLVEKFANKKEIESFSPVTQLVFLYLFYHNKKFLIAELAEILQYSMMSICRAYKELVDCGLFEYAIEGRNKYIYPRYEGGELLREAEPYFINPIVKTLYIKNTIKTKKLLKAGLYALSEKSMLNVNVKDICFATSKVKNYCIEDRITKAEYLIWTGIKLEHWAYNPELLSTDDNVDDISLILSLRDNKDERVMLELDEIRRKYQWLEE